jgi:hypothetical protein
MYTRARTSFLVAALVASVVATQPFAQAVESEPTIALTDGSVTDSTDRWNLDDARAVVEGKEAEVANVNDISVSALDEVFDDPNIWVDDRGRLVAFDATLPPPPPPSTSRAGDAPGPFPDAQTFLLHSRPGSNRTIYLDFDGAVLVNTIWNSYSSIGTAPFLAAPFDIAADNNPAVFSPAERTIIQNVWRQVAEDYAAFDVDVTTQAPDPAALLRSDSADQVYGTTGLITDMDQNLICGCGGYAYIGVVNEINNTYLQPALIFANTMYDNQKYLGEIASHELGHNFGLTHDGQSGNEYYGGHNLWAPIMGAGYSYPVTTFSKGEYANANNTELDLTVIQSEGASYFDDAGSSTSSGYVDLGASGTLPGSTQSFYINDDVDVDVFSFVAGAGAFSISAGNTFSPNLDIRMEVLDTNLATIGDVNPTSAYVNYETVSGMGATLSGVFATAGRKYVRISGVGNGTGITGYTDYGSVGRYELSGSYPVNAPGLGVPTGVVASSSSAGVVNVSWVAPTGSGAGAITYYRVNLTAQGSGVSTYGWVSASSSSIVLSGVVAGSYTAVVYPYTSSTQPGSVPTAPFAVS